MSRIGSGASNPYINQTEIAKPAEQNLKQHHKKMV
jgi:hypothetical protein